MLGIFEYIFPYCGNLSESLMHGKVVHTAGVPLEAGNISRHCWLSSDFDAPRHIKIHVYIVYNKLQLRP